MNEADARYSKELGVAIRLARSAGALAMRYRGQDLDIQLKDGKEPVTVADREASQLIVGGLLDAFAPDVVISEENADAPARQTSQRVWFVDPIDGTRDFISGDDGFCVMIGLAIATRPAVGVIFHPPSQELLFAATGAGAWLVPAPNATPIALQVSTTDSLSAARMVGTSGIRPIAEQAPRLSITGRNQIGAIGLKLAIVAAGDCDLFFNPASRSSVWDTCAPEVVLREAGGRLTDINDQPLVYHDADTRNRRGIIGSNGRLHSMASKRLRPLDVASRKP